MKTFLVLPHQLFNKKFLSKDFEYLLWEHPHYFQKYNYNKKETNVTPIFNEVL